MRAQGVRSEGPGAQELKSRSSLEEACSRISELISSHKWHEASKVASTALSQLQFVRGSATELVGSAAPQSLTLSIAARLRTEGLRGDLEELRVGTEDVRVGMEELSTWLHWVCAAASWDAGRVVECKRGLEGARSLSLRAERLRKGVQGAGEVEAADGGLGDGGAAQAEEAADPGARMVGAEELALSGNLVTCHVLEGLRIHAQGGEGQSVSAIKNEALRLKVLAEEGLASLNQSGSKRRKLVVSAGPAPSPHSVLGLTADGVQLAQVVLGLTSTFSSISWYISDLEPPVKELLDRVLGWMAGSSDLGRPTTPDTRNALKGLVSISSALCNLGPCCCGFQGPSVTGSAFVSGPQERQLLFAGLELILVRISIATSGGEDTLEVLEEVERVVDQILGGRCVAASPGSLASKARKLDNGWMSLKNTIILHRSASLYMTQQNLDALRVLKDFKLTNRQVSCPQARYLEGCLSLIEGRRSASGGQELPGHRPSTEWLDEAILAFEACQSDGFRVRDAMNGKAYAQVLRSVSAPRQRAEMSPDVPSGVWEALATLEQSLRVESHSLDQPPFSLFNVSVLYQLLGKPNSEEKMLLLCLKNLKHLPKDLLWARDGLQGVEKAARCVGHANPVDSGTSVDSLSPSEYLRYRLGKSALLQGHFVEASKSLQTFLRDGDRDDGGPTQLDQSRGIPASSQRTGSSCLHSNFHLRSLLELELAFCYLQLGKADMALKICDQILSKDPSSPGALKMKADSLVCLERADDALPVLDKLILMLSNSMGPDGSPVCLEVKEELAEAHNNRSLVLNCMKCADAAQVSLEKCLELFPQHQIAAYNYTLLLWQQKREMDASTYWMKHRRIDKSYDECKRHRTQALIALDGGSHVSESHVVGRLRDGQVHELDVLILDWWIAEMEVLQSAAFLETLESQ